MSYRFVRGPRGYRGPQGYDGSIGQTGYTGSASTESFPELPETVMRTNISKTMEQKIIQDQTDIQISQSRNIYMSANLPNQLLGNDGDIWVIISNLYGTIYTATGSTSDITISIQEV